jgi:hypothetical protein
MPHHSSSELVDYPRQSFSARALGKHADSFPNNKEIFTCLHANSCSAQARVARSATVRRARMHC